jgi:hypothetical protein
LLTAFPISTPSLFNDANGQRPEIGRRFPDPTVYPPWLWRGRSEFLALRPSLCGSFSSTRSSSPPHPYQNPATCRATRETLI